MTDDVPIDHREVEECDIAGPVGIRDGRHDPTPPNVELVAKSR